MKKHALLYISALLGALLLCGCAKSASHEEPAAPVFEEPQYEWGKLSDQTLSLWGRDTDLDRVYITRALSRYEELTGNTVEITAFSAEELEQAAAAALQSGENGPDLILSFGGVNIDSFKPDENLYDFSDAPWVDDLTDTSLNQTIYHGKVIGLPHWEASISGTLYNKKIFSKLKLEPPKTQEEFMQVCETLLKNGITPLYLPCATPTMLLYQFPLDILVEDDATLRGLNEGTLGYENLPEMRTIVHWYRTMAEKGYLGEHYEENSWDGMSGALESGRYAMLLGWDTWLYTNYEGEPADFGLMPAFIGIPKAGTFEGPNLSLMLVNRHSSHLDAAVDLVTFMADPYNYNVAFEGIYTAPVFKNQLSNISTPQYVEASGWIEQNFHDSTAWLRIRGFSQSDASCILTYMLGRDDYTAEQCLRDMEALRRKRLP